MKAMKMLTLIGLVAATMVVGGPSQAYAAATYCSVFGDPNQDGLRTTDVTLGGGIADDCYGLRIEDSVSTSEVNATLWGPGFTGISDGGSATFTDLVTPNQIKVDFSLNESNGTWKLIFSDPAGAPAATFSQFFDIVLALEEDDVPNDSHNNDRWALYLFDDVEVTGIGEVAGTWSFSSAFSWGYNATPRIDASKLFIKNGTPTTGGESSSGDAAVPEPASLLLLGSGLGLAAWRARRKATSKP